MLRCECVFHSRLLSQCSLNRDRRWQLSSSFSHREAQIEDFRGRRWWWWSPTQLCNYVQITARASCPIRALVIALSKPVSEVMMCMCAERSQTARLGPSGHGNSIWIIMEDGWSHVLQVKAAVVLQTSVTIYSTKHQMIKIQIPPFSRSFKTLNPTFKYLQSHPVTTVSENHAQSDALEWSLHQTLAPCILMEPLATAEAHNRLEPAAASSFLPIVFIFVNCVAPTLRSGGTCVVDTVFSLQCVWCLFPSRSLWTLETFLMHNRCVSFWSATVYCWCRLTHRATHMQKYTQII